MDRLLARDDVVVYMRQRGTRTARANTSSDDFVVTRGRANKDKSRLAVSSWEDETWISNFNADDFRGYPNIQRLTQNAFSVHMAGKIFGEGDVEQIILSAIP